MNSTPSPIGTSRSLSPFASISGEVYAAFANRFRAREAVWHGAHGLSGRWIFFLLLVVSIASTSAADLTAMRLAEKAIAAAGGRSNLIRFLSFRDHVVMGATNTGFGSRRESVVDAPRHWWLKAKTGGYVERKSEPALFLVWAWTLGALTDTNSTLESVASIEDHSRTLHGIQISKTIVPPMEMYFDSHGALARIDWRDDIHRFTNWITLPGGIRYPSSVVGYKKATGKIWYFDDVTNVVSLSNLPDALPPASDTPR